MCEAGVSVSQFAAFRRTRRTGGGVRTAAAGHARYGAVICSCTCSGSGETRVCSWDSDGLAMDGADGVAADD